MSLFSKLFGGDKEAEKTAKDLLNAFFSNANTENKKTTDEPKEHELKTENVDTPRQKGPSGMSWGEEMPDEENQYNFNGTYHAYFENIFKAEFPQFSFNKECLTSKRTIYTFNNGISKVLVVELMSQSSAAQGIRRQCEKENVPYLRFYIDHDGWWNTRAYVSKRMHDAVK